MHRNPLEFMGQNRENWKGGEGGEGGQLAAQVAIRWSSWVGLIEGISRTSGRYDSIIGSYSTGFLLKLSRILAPQFADQRMMILPLRD